MRILRNIISRYFTHRWSSVFVLYVFLIFLAIGIGIHGDYGVSSDEPAVRKFGNDAFAYLFRGGPMPTEQDWAFFNPIVPVAMRGLELTFRLTDGADIWFLRHLVTFLLFFGTVIVFYRIARRRFENWKLPLLGSVMFLLSPRLFAHGFYNPKDVPAMLFFTLSAWTLLRLLEKRTASRLIIHVMVTAILISMRTFGWMMPVLAVMFLWMNGGSRSGSDIHTRPGTGTLSVIYVAVLATTLFLIWPQLWHDPVHGLLGAFLNNTSRLGGGFYFGQQISAAGVPWHYLPVWIGVTTPVVYSFCFLVGLVTIGVQSAIAPKGGCADLFYKHPVMGLALLWFVLPVLALLILPIGIFDEWRHMLFLYPAFLLIALEGLWWLLMIAKKFSEQKARILQWIICGVLGLQMTSTGLWMIRNHPFEYAYFSIPTRFIDGNFELDYWGLSYRAGLEWIVKNDPREHINVFTVARTGKAAADTLPLKDWNRLYFAEQFTDADYILDNFRGSGYVHTFPEEKKVHAVVIDELELLAIYREPLAHANH